MIEDPKTMNIETGDSASMTIEFLRARLLSERSVSATARQRADELAKKVLELEDRLKFISHQRKIAEKATSHLLAILENNGLQFNDLDDLDLDVDVSEEAGDSTPDHDFRPPCGSEANTVNHDEPSSRSKPNTTLSWKTIRDRDRERDRDARRSIQKKYFDSTSTRRNSFSSSPKHQSGKSCRQIGRRQTRSTTEELRNEDGAIAPQTNVLGSPHLEGEMADSLCPNSDGGDKDMERALLQQAQLIGRYEEEEKAQREWEDKLRETNSSTPDTNEPGNQSDITEEIYESKTGTAAPIASENQDAVSGAVEVCFHPPAYTQDQMSSSELDCGSLPSAESKAKEKQTQKQYPSSHDHLRTGTHESLINQSASFISSTNDSSRGETLRNRNERYAIVPHKPPVEIGGVLEALQAAKSSIQKRLARLPLLEGGGSSRIEVPVGCSGLFRVPSDTHFEGTKKTNFQDPSAQLSRTTSYPDKGSGPSVFSYDGYMPNSYYSQKPYSNFLRDLSGVSHNYPSYRSFPDLKGGMASSTEGITRSSVPSGVNGTMSSPKNFSFYNDGVRPNVYR